MLGTRPRASHSRETLAVFPAPLRSYLQTALTHLTNPLKLHKHKTMLFYTIKQHPFKRNLKNPIQNRFKINYNQTANTDQKYLVMKLTKEVKELNTDKFKVLKTWGTILKYDGPTTPSHGSTQAVKRPHHPKRPIDASIHQNTTPLFCYGKRKSNLVIHRAPE